VRQLRIGLTGGIGSGKSTVAAHLVSRGLTLVDTDAIARELTGSSGAAMASLRSLFGDGVVAPDGSLQRERMRALAFRDAGARRRLESVLHPMIGAEAQALAAAAPGAVVFDVPLLAESDHWRDRVDRILVVDCSEATQIERVRSRSNWNEDAARAVMASQATRSSRRAVADAWIFNDGIDVAQLSREVDAILTAWQPDPR
jgi:dephospho-CoA kinase